MMSKWMTVCLCGVLSVSTLACNKQKVEEEPVKEEVSQTPPPRDDVTDESGAVLAIAPFRIFEAEQPDQFLEMNGDGAIMVQGQEAVRVHADGRMTRGDQLIVTLMPDGTIVDASGQVLPVKIDAQGVATMEGDETRLYFAEDGSIAGQNENAPLMASEGCTGDVARTCVFVLLVSAMTASTPPPPPNVEGQM